MRSSSVLCLGKGEQSHVFAASAVRCSSLVIATVVAASMAGCSPQAQSPATSAAPAPQMVIDQAQLCEVNAWQHDLVASVCKPGQKVVFLPRSFGNAQLPILFAAVNCDLRYAVALTEGAVTCIYSPIQPAPAQPAATDASQPASKP
ncbi:hypothetical protein [Simplicispira lacusdiani]|uniref:hypothetical protein n=1 Tax=Simplicispira lacusdiani TaxID=2213010 RepID=UPI0013004AC9|nr:hypothetical protein [Simplicispira lacusdiani]